MIRLKWFASKLLPQILYECTSTSIPLKFSSKAAFIDLFKLEYPQILLINTKQHLFQFLKPSTSETAFFAALNLAFMEVWRTWQCGPGKPGQGQYECGLGNASGGQK